MAHLAFCQVRLLNGNAMKTLLQLMMPAVVLPVLLSFGAHRLGQRHRNALWTLPAIWLPSYVWLNGWPQLPSREANDWLWLVALVSTLTASLLRQRKYVMAAQIVLLVTALSAMVWPLRHLIDATMAAELLATLTAGSLSFYRPAVRTTVPALGLAVSASGLGLVASLGGSLLIGQLAVALAAVLSAFALSELSSRGGGRGMDAVFLMPLLQLYFLLLMIARIYADLAVGPAFLLLSAPLVGLLTPHRYGALGSAASASAAFAWLLITADSSSYY